MTASKNLDEYLTSLESLHTSFGDLNPNTPNKESMLKQIEGMRLFIEVFKRNQEVNNQISYQILMKLECERLKEMMELALDSDEIEADAREILESAKQEFRGLSTKIEKTFAIFEPKNVHEKLQKILFDLPWAGDSGYLTFKTPELLGKIISSLCEARMAMSGSDSVHFKIFLPPLTEFEAEQMKNTGETRDSLDTKYAKVAFEAAAKKGFSPDKCNIKINNITISPKESRFTGLYETWQKLASERQTQLRQETWRNTLKEPAPEVKPLNIRKP